MSVEKGGVVSEVVRIVHLMYRCSKEGILRHTPLGVTSSRTLHVRIFKWFVLYIIYWYILYTKLISGGFVALMLRKHLDRFFGNGFVYYNK
jgi:hypothetical protein